MASVKSSQRKMNFLFRFSEECLHWMEWKQLEEDKSEPDEVCLCLCPITVWIHDGRLLQPDVLGCSLQQHTQRLVLERLALLKNPDVPSSQNYKWTITIYFTAIKHITTLGERRAQPSSIILCRRSDCLSGPKALFKQYIPPENERAWVGGWGWVRMTAHHSLCVSPGQKKKVREADGGRDAWKKWRNIRSCQNISL